MKTIVIRVRLRTRRAERELRSSLPFARSAHPRGAYFLKTCFQKVKKTTEAVFLEKVFLMGYLIKLQNVLGRLRDYNSSSFIFRKYQGFTKLTNSLCGFCAFSTNKVPVTRLTPYLQHFYASNNASNSSRPIFSFSNKSCAQFSKISLFSRSIALAFA